MLGWSLLALGAGLAGAALLGPLLTGVIHYRVSGLLTSQLEGVDALSLVLVAPLCAVLGILALRGGSKSVGALALAPGSYALYMTTETIVGPDYSRFAGNNERFFLLFLGIFLFAGTVTLTAWRTLPTSEPAMDRHAQRLTGGLFVVLGSLLAVGRYLPSLIDVLRGDAPSADYVAGPNIYWTVTWQDLGIVLPALFAAGVGLWRGRDWAVRLSYAVAGWCALVPVAVVAMAIASYVDHQPAASVGAIAMLTVFAAAFLIPPALCWRPLLSERPRTEPASTDLTDRSSSRPFRREARRQQSGRRSTPAARSRPRSDSRL